MRPTVTDSHPLPYTLGERRPIDHSMGGQGNAPENTTHRPTRLIAKKRTHPLSTSWSSPRDDSRAPRSTHHPGGRHRAQAARRRSSSSSDHPRSSSARSHRRVRSVRKQPDLSRSGSHRNDDLPAPTTGAHHQPHVVGGATSSPGTGLQLKPYEGCPGGEESTRHRHLPPPVSSPGHPGPRPSSSGALSGSPAVDGKGRARPVITASPIRLFKLMMMIMGPRPVQLRSRARSPFSGGRNRRSMAVLMGLLPHVRTSSSSIVLGGLLSDLTGLNIFLSLRVSPREYLSSSSRPLLRSRSCRRCAAKDGGMRG